jgi:hypothetical protein
MIMEKYLPFIIALIIITISYALMKFFDKCDPTFQLQNYNEFKDVQWHDYVAIIIHEFPILLVRRYNFGLHSEEMTTTYLVQILGFKIG